MKIVLFRSSFFLDFLLFLFIEYLQRKKIFLNFPVVETKNFIFSCLLANLFWNLNWSLDSNSSSSFWDELSDIRWKVSNLSSTSLKWKSVTNIDVNLSNNISERKKIWAVVEHYYFIQSLYFLSIYSSRLIFIWFLFLLDGINERKTTFYYIVMYFNWEDLIHFDDRKFLSFRFLYKIIQLHSIEMKEYRRNQRKRSDQSDPIGR